MDVSTHRCRCPPSVRCMGKFIHIFWWEKCTRYYNFGWDGGALVVAVTAPKMWFYAIYVTPWSGNMDRIPSLSCAALTVFGDVLSVCVCLFFRVADGADGMEQKNIAWNGKWKYAMGSAGNGNVCTGKPAHGHDWLSVRGNRPHFRGGKTENVLFVLVLNSPLWMDILNWINTFWMPTLIWKGRILRFLLWGRPQPSF